VTVEELFGSVQTRSVGRFGKPGDPWNLLWIGSEEAVVRTLETGGWHRIPRSIPAAIALGIADLLSGKRLTRFPPMNLYRVEDRIQDHNWAIPVRAIHERHHFRLWRLNASNPSGRPFWWGSGNYDLDSRLRDLSHRPDPDIDKERDFIGATIERGHGVESTELRPCRRIPREGRNDKGYPFYCDGRVLVVTLKASEETAEAGPRTVPKGRRKA